MHMLVGEVNVAFWLGGANKRGTIADHLLVPSAPVHSLSRKCMGFDTGYSYLPAEYRYFF